VVVKSNVESFEPGGIFAGDDVGAGIDAGFEGVVRGSGFAFGGRGAGGFPGVATVALTCASVDMIESQPRASTRAAVLAVDGSGRDQEEQVVGGAGL